MKGRLRIRNIITSAFAEAPASGIAEAMRVRKMMERKRDFVLQWLSTQFGNKFSSTVSNLGPFNCLAVEFSENGGEFELVLRWV